VFDHSIAAAKEGLALINGTQFIASLGAVMRDYLPSSPLKV